MKYTAQRHRLDALEAALGRPGAVLRIEGGLPANTAMPQDPSPVSPQPKDGTSATAGTGSASPKSSAE
jgi:hypothetical protein